MEIIWYKEQPEWELGKMSRKDATKKSWYEHVIFKILGMIVILIAIDQYIDYKIANKFDDSQIARRIASQIRPSLIFDHNRTIRWDFITAFEREL